MAVVVRRMVYWVHACTLAKPARLSTACFSLKAQMPLFHEVNMQTRRRFSLRTIRQIVLLASRDEAKVEARLEQVTFLLPPAPKPLGIGPQPRHLAELVGNFLEVAGL